MYFSLLLLIIIYGYVTIIIILLHHIAIAFLLFKPIAKRVSVQ